MRIPRCVRAPRASTRGYQGPSKFLSLGFVTFNGIGANVHHTSTYRPKRKRKMVVTGRRVVVAVAVAAFAAYEAVLEPDDGAVRWRTPLERRAGGGLLAQGERIYALGAAPATVQAFGLEGSTPLWQYPAQVDPKALHRLSGPAWLSPEALALEARVQVEVAAAGWQRVALGLKGCGLRSAKVQRQGIKSGEELRAKVRVSPKGGYELWAQGPGSFALSLDLAVPRGSRGYGFQAVPALAAHMADRHAERGPALAPQMAAPASWG